MSLGKNNRRWIRVALLASVLVFAGIASAEITEPLNRFGRTFGVGWGDGYHACGRDRIRLVADLPPRSYAARQHHAFSSRSRVGLTFYDQFDASSGRACDSCDSAPSGTMIQGSQVSFGKSNFGLDRSNSNVEPWQQSLAKGESQMVPVNPTPAPAIQRPMLDPIVESNSKADNKTRTAMSRPRHATETRLKQPVFSKPRLFPTRPSEAEAVAPVPISRQMPISPAARILASPSVAIPVGTRREETGFGLKIESLNSAAYRKKMAKDQRAASSESRPTRQFNHLAMPSRTPKAITPVHPQAAKSSNTTKSRSLDARPATPSPESLRYPTLVPPQRAEQPRAEQPRPTRPITTTPNEPFRSAVDGRDIEKKNSIVLRPARLGSRSSGLANPYAAKPVLELAERSKHFDDHVIRQPSTQR